MSSTLFTRFTARASRVAARQAPRFYTTVAKNGHRYRYGPAGLMKRSPDRRLEVLNKKSGEWMDVSGDKGFERAADFDAAPVDVETARKFERRIQKDLEKLRGKESEKNS